MTSHQRRALQPDTFEGVDLPIGRQPIPEWCSGLAIDWMDNYGNSPAIHVRMRAGHDAFEWPGLSWIIEDKDHYRAYSNDGRLKQHAHNGRLTWSDERSAWVSSPSEGYGGRGFEIQMQDGFEVYLEGKERNNRFDPWASWAATICFSGDRRKVILRGPWHTSPPAGFHSVTMHETKEDRYYKPGTKRWRPWHQRGGYFGLFLSTDLLLRLIARFQPTLRVAAVTRYGTGPCLEPVREDWDAPKNWPRPESAQPALSVSSKDGTGGAA